MTHHDEGASLTKPQTTLNCSGRAYPNRARLLIVVKKKKHTHAGVSRSWCTFFSFLFSSSLSLFFFLLVLFYKNELLGVELSTSTVMVPVIAVCVSTTRVQLSVGRATAVGNPTAADTCTFANAITGNTSTSQKSKFQTVAADCVLRVCTVHSILQDITVQSTISMHRNCARQQYTR